MKNQRSFRKQKEKNYSAPLLFCSYHICNKIIPKIHPMTRTRQPENNLMGTDNSITRIARGRLKSRFAFIIYQRNIFSSFYLLRRVHKLHVFN